jgi:hypothetical protein
MSVGTCNLIQIKVYQLNYQSCTNGHTGSLNCPIKIFATIEVTILFLIWLNLRLSVSYLKTFVLLHLIDETEDGVGHGLIEAKKLVFSGEPEKTHKNLSVIMAFFQTDTGKHTP